MGKKVRISMRMKAITILIFCVFWGGVIPAHLLFAQNAPITFSATGDIPYGSSEVPVLLQQLADHNLYSTSEFMIHLGDLKSGSSSCSEDKYIDFASYMQELAVPVYLIPGDNEYNDCNNPTQAWSFWETHLSYFENHFCGAPVTERQSVRQENFAFVEKGVLFIGINLVGGTVQSSSEWAQRMQDDIDWIDDQFQTHGASVRTAVIFAHAGPGRSAHDLFFDQFDVSAAAFNKPILFLHADGHTWINDFPFSNNDIMRVQIDAGGDAPPLQVTVTTDDSSPSTLFLFDRDPFNGASVYNVAPCVEAGPDSTITGPGTITLLGQASDDGVPTSPGTLTLNWTKQSGPGTVSFGNTASPTSSATFSANGAYVLRLTADDGEIQVFDEVNILVGGTGPLVSIDDISLVEGDAGSSSAQFTVTLSSAGAPVTVDYATSDVTATAGSDYQAASGTLNLSAASPSQTIDITVYGDTEIESDEVFNIILSNAVNATIAKPTGEGTILNDDIPQPPVITDFTPASGPVGTEVTFSGLNFLSITSVSFNGLSAAFVIDSDETLRATVPIGTLSGPVTLTNADGSTASNTDFIVTHTLALNTTGVGSVEVIPAGSIFDQGSSVTLVAHPDPAYKLNDWSGDGSGSSDTLVIVMDSDKSVTANFLPLSNFQFTLTVNTSGSGSVTVNPAGTLFTGGTTVTLTATPSPGYIFLGWSGDANGALNPESVYMNGDKVITANFADPSLTPVTLQEVQTGGSENLTTVSTSAPLGAAEHHLYLAAITNKSGNSVTGVSGLGLSWSLVKAQCSARGHAWLEVWMAQGNPAGSDTVTATFDSAPVAAAIAVSRYAFVDTLNPIGTTVSGNTLGTDGACSGGSDTDIYSFNLSTTRTGSMFYGALGCRHRTHDPGAGFTEQAEFAQGSSSNMATIAVVDSLIELSTTVNFNGSFSSNVDWSAIGLEIHRMEAPLTTYTLTTQTSGLGSVLVSPAGTVFDSAMVVTLSAVPDPGYVFIRWEGDLSGSANPDSLVMDGDKNVTAVFEQKFALDVQTSGSGSVALNPAGGIYDSAMVVTLSATPDSGYAFNGWSGDLSGNANPDSIVMDGNKNVTASFIARYALNLTTIGHGTVTVSPDTSGGIYDSATVVTLVATPDPGYAFSGWSGDLSGAASPDSLVMDGDKNVTATFRVQFDLTVSSSGNGAVALDPPGGVYDSSTVVTLSALPDSGYAFTGWSGDLSGNANPDSVVMDSNKAVTANFALLSTLQFNLSVTASAGGSVILDPPGSLHNGGTTVILSAVPDSGYTFGGWSGDLSGSANPDSIYLDGDKQVAAIFLPRYTLSTSIFGDGTITLDPPGGVYDSAAVVTLTALPGAGYSFEKWLGDLSGSDTTVQLTMNTNKHVSASFVLYQLGEIQHLGTVSGGSSGSTTVATSVNVSAAEGDLYLAAISSKSQEPVLTVSGMGLSWTLKEDQCAGRSNTGVEIWWAQGTPSGDGIVSATFGSAPTSAVITVSRYTGVHPTAPLGASVAGNTLGVNGSCSGGTDSDNYNFSLSTSVADAYVFSAAAIRNRSHTPGSGYSEIGEYSQGSGGDMAALALQHKPQPTVGSTAVDGTLSSDTDWAVAGVEILPGSGAPRYTLSIATVGNGSITVDPGGSIFDSSAVVTLTATPDSGYTFSSWSGDLSGTLNPQTLTMDFHKSVTATFAQNQPLLADVKVYLQGFYSEADSAMHTGLRDSSLLPLAQPFSSAPWLYSGTEQVDSIPSGVVDWVLVKLRTSPAAGDEVAVRSGFLHRDGHIYDLDGISPLAFPGLPPGGYYLVVDHRNHLAVMSSTAHALDFVANLYDFSTAQGQAYGPDPLVVLPGGRLAMPAGDANGDNAVDTADKLSYWRNQNGTFWTYDKLSDFNGDGSIDAADLNRYWRPNDGKTSQVPAAQPGVQTKPVNRAAQW